MTAPQTPPFADRRDAGRKLAPHLARFRADNPLVLALPRGGVPVAFEIAQSLGAKLDLLMVRKIGAPGMKEYGIGAVVEGHDPQVLLDDECIRIVNPPADYVEAEVARQLRTIAQRRQKYLGDRPLPAVTGRTVIVVDDGIATGNTALAAVRAMRRAEARRIVLAVPIAAAGGIEKLAPEVDDIVCLGTPMRFHSVGENYKDFSQTTDQEVIRLLAASAT